MAQTTIRGRSVTVVGNGPRVGDIAPSVLLADRSPAGFLVPQLGRRTILTTFPTVTADSAILSARRLRDLTRMRDALVVCVSHEPVAVLERFLRAADLEPFRAGSAEGSDLGGRYGLTLGDGELAGCLARAIVMVEPTGRISSLEVADAVEVDPYYGRVADLPAASTGLRWAA